MGYSKALYEQAVRTLARRRMDAENEAAALKERAIARDPRVAQIDRLLTHSALQVARAVLNGLDNRGGEDIHMTMRRLQEENMALQQELADRLHNMGERADNFLPRPTCAACGDTGYVGQKMCTCLETLLREGACEQLSALSGMTLTSFDELDMTFYSDTPDADGVSPRERMADIIDFCRDWAADFSADSQSLLLRGPAGTGKTHLSLAMAGEVAAKGYQVVYGSAGRLLRQMEKEHFGRDGGDSADRMEECDLLILDDLGTEFATPFYTSALYDILNTRVLSGRATILSTNLSVKQLEERYGVQIASRIAGCFLPLLFVGNDIRKQKQMRTMRADT